MKKTKKKVFVVALAICIIAILSLGTLAWFTAEDEVTNDFHFATSGSPATTDFGVDVYEKDADDNEYDVEPNQGGITYENIIPGDVLVKKAYVKNISSTQMSATGTTNYSQFIRATVKISDGGVIKATSTLSDLETVKSIINFDAFSASWLIDSCTYDATAEEYVVVLYATNILEPATDVQLFSSVTVPNWLEVDDANTMGNTFSVTVKAEAVQSDNTNYSTAKAAFENLVD